ncbi:MAG TPA: stress response translation initiation inhibitor YciH [Desulfobacterales bacterium]|nr:stress response translation initiation inhibitor YciH [Desulfobacterales bacterium]HIP40007.1 stress response translation initiation inhibitor YciH [Desulfocapsa sulfexigens]
MKRKSENSRLVYSTESGKVLPIKETKGKKGKKQSAPPNDGIVRLMRQTKGRKGKGVTLITGLPLDKDALKKLAKSLKQKCGSGGSVKNGVVEIQGDHRDILEQELGRLGYKVKRAGG